MMFAVLDDLFASVKCKKECRDISAITMKMKKRDKVVMEAVAVSKWNHNFQTKHYVNEKPS